MTGPWSTLVSVGAVTFAYRLSCMASSRRVAAFIDSERWRKLLRFVPPAAFAALVAPAVLVRNGSLVSTPLDPRLIAACVALGFALLTRNVLLTLVSGMVALHAVRFFLL